MGEIALLPPTGLNDRISHEYLEIQRKYHEERNHYGTTGQHYVRDVRQLVDSTGATSILDYGCGKGTLKRELGDIVTEYDPAIPGKDDEPKLADLVVCTDVLEHIEPNKLDSVLEHIRRLGKWFYFVIATRPANKHLPDGRNAHLIIKDANWWLNKLSEGFDVQEHSKQELGLSVFATPFILIGEINGVGVLDYSERMANVRANIKVTKKRIALPKFIQYVSNDIPMFGIRIGFGPNGVSKWAIPKPHNRVALIMCYGPSLNDTWHLVKEEVELIKNADIVSVSGAHDFLIERGIVPKYHIECDPRPHKGDMMQKISNRTEYLMASVCHPDVVKRLKGKKLTLWHMNEGDPSLQILELEPSSPLVPGGGSVGLRSMAVLYLLGYRRFLIHGMDCSYKDGASHAGHHTGKKPNTVEVRCTDGRKFMTAPVLITYKRYFDELRRMHSGDADKDPGKVEIILRGDGLLQHWLKRLGGASNFTPETEAA